jgi:hypothetical protein
MAKSRLRKQLDRDFYRDRRKKRGKAKLLPPGKAPSIDQTGKSCPSWGVPCVIGHK